MEMMSEHWIQEISQSRKDSQHLAADCYADERLGLQIKRLQYLAPASGLAIEKLELDGRQGKQVRF